MQPARGYATYKDVLEAPEHMIAEIVDHSLELSPRPSVVHALAASAIQSDVHGAFHRRLGAGGPGGWWILFEPELHLGPDVVVPDIAGWRRDRLPRLPESAFTTAVPDWICEVVSPKSGGFDRVRKMRAYAREGVGHAWLVEPLQQTLEVFRLVAGQWLVTSLHAREETVRAEPFEAIEIHLLRWWTDSE